MDFNLNVNGRIVLDASPELLEAVAQFSGMFKSPVSFDAPKPARGKRTKAEMATTVEEPQLEATEAFIPEVAPVVEVTATATPGTNAAKYTLVQVRAAMTAKQESYPAEEQRPVMLKMRDILVALGTKSVGELAEDKYEEFIQKISAL